MVRLDDGPGGATLHLVGVSHVLVDDAARDIRALMHRLRPDAVVLELCAERAPAAMAAALAGVSADTASPPAVIPRAVRIEGLPSKPIPGASEAELLSLLHARAGAVVTPRDLARDRDALLALGHFREVDVDVLDADAVTAAPALVGARLDSATDALGSVGPSRAVPLTEVIAVRSVALRVAPDAAAAVTADIRFSWGRRARRAFGDRAGVEREIVRRALETLLLLEEAEAEAEDEEALDAEATEEAFLWEGVALRSALGVSARAACPGASVDVFRVASDDADDGADEGGALWVRVAVDGERTFPRVSHGGMAPVSDDGVDEGGEGDASEADQVPTRSGSGSREKKNVAATTRVARAAEALRSVSSLPSASLAARAYLAASELAQELVAARLDQKAPAGAETSAALAAAMAAGARAVVLGDVPASETLTGVTDGLKGASRDKKKGGFSTLSSVLDAPRAFASVFASDKAALRSDVAAALRGFAAEENGDESENEPFSRAPAALVDALVTRRDAHLFDAAWSLAARDAVTRALVPAYARVASAAAAPEPFALYAFEKAWDPSRLLAPGEAELSRKRERATVIVAVVGAAHVEGIARRWREKSAKRDS